MTARTEGLVPGEVPLRYVEWGARDAPPVVLLHGLRAYAHWFDDFAAAADQKFRLIGLDQRGRGGSGKAPDGQYTTDAYVADIARLAAFLGLRRFSLIGHSMGGTNAYNYAATYPAQIACLVIVDSAPELDIAGLTRIRNELGRTPARFATLNEAEAFLRGLHPRASEASIAARLKWMLKQEPDGRYGWRIDPAIFDPKLAPDPPARGWAALEKITCPTLLVRGAISDLITREMADKVCATVQHCTCAEVPDAGHMILEDNPDGFNATVLPFLEAQLF